MGAPDEKAEVVRVSVTFAVAWAVSFLFDVVKEQLVRTRATQRGIVSVEI